MEHVLTRALHVVREENIDFRKSLPTDYLNYMGVAHEDLVRNYELIQVGQFRLLLPDTFASDNFTKSAFGYSLNGTQLYMNVISSRSIDYRIEILCKSSWLSYNWMFV